MPTALSVPGADGLGAARGITNPRAGSDQRSLAAARSGPPRVNTFCHFVGQPFRFGPVHLASLTRLTKNEQYSRWASLLVLYMAYFQFPLVFGLDFFLPYDLPSLLFFCACLYCVISRRMLWFYLFFVVGTFNRETICMATLFLAIWGWEESKGREDILALAGHVLTQAAIWIVIKLYLYHLFAGNLAETAGATFYYKLGYNLRIFLKPWEWPVLLSVFGFTLPLVLGWRKWMRKPPWKTRSIFWQHGSW